MKKAVTLPIIYVLISTIAFWVIHLPGVQAAVWYVDNESACEAGCGTGWGTAFNNIQSAVDNATSGDEIWVKAGTYDLSNQINVDKAVFIYGGFAGTETEREERDWVVNITTVNGQNSVRCFYKTDNAIIDGFTITGGNASGSYPDNNGGGIYIDDTSPAVTNCTFYDNTAYAGSGIYNKSGSPTITNCTFSGNIATNSGGGIGNYLGSPVITNCAFYDSATYHGGGIYNTSGSPTITNCTFFRNSATYYGGGIYSTSGSPTITNCTFSGNSAGSLGGGIYISSGTPTIINSILWGNSADTGPEISGTATPRYCNIDQDGYEGSNGNIRRDPLFASDYHLQAGSPCIDNGTADNAPANDIDNETRPIGDGYDMGSDEFYDLDGDDIADYWEIKWFDDITTHSDATDEDGDGLSDLGEYEAGTDPFDSDTDDDGFGDGEDGCPADPDKTEPGGCGCGVPDTDTDSDGDGTPDCNDNCPSDPDKTEPGGCGCGVPDTDSDGDGTPDCNDGCPSDPDKTEPGVCGCGNPETDPCYSWYVDNSIAVSGDGRSWGNAFKTIQEAVDTASDFHEIWVKAGTYYLSDQISVEKPVSIYGGFAGTEDEREERDRAANPTVIDGQDAVYHCLYITDDATVDGFTITGGNASGSSPDYHGGGMYIDHASPTIANCTISGNSADYGGGISAYYSSPVITNCTISGNSAYLVGGGIRAYSGSPVITNCTISGNSAVHRGGAISAIYSSPVITNCTINDNSADYDGGGINAYDSSPAITNCTISGNSAVNMGGGINADYSSPVITNCTISGNFADWDGGGIYAYYSSPVITNCTINDNSAVDGGGGINAYESSPAITNCTISGNSAYRGGGIFADYSSPVITNCTINGNSANFDGGGIYVIYGSPAITNCTISGNSAYRGGGIYDYYGSTKITNCILWEDTAGTGQEIYEVSSVSVAVTVTIDVSYCDIDQDGYGNPDGSPDASGNMRRDPQLTGDYHLRATSPCIDIGTDEDAPAFDRDNETRPWPYASGYDIGADEFMDSDGDELADYWELEWFGDLSPDAGSDNDTDGLSNLEEYNLGVTDPTVTDTDGDGISDGTDNCPADNNSDQTDCDADGVGDVCDPDMIGHSSNTDNDYYLNICDNCPYVGNEDQADSDNDTFGDACDNCPYDYNPDQTDADGDGDGDACDNDTDISGEGYIFERLWPVMLQPWFFDRPSGIALDNSTYVYIVDAGNHRIQKFTRDGRFVTKWGSFGTDNGTFLNPRGIAVDKTGNVYVADSDNNSIQKFSSNGEFRGVWHNGSDGIPFNSPWGIAIDNSTVYVVDSENHRIQKLSLDGVPILSWEVQISSDPGECTQTTDSSDCIDVAPKGIAIDNNGYVYVTAPGDGVVWKFDSEGNEAGPPWYLGNHPPNDEHCTGGPQGIAVDNSGNFYIFRRGIFPALNFDYYIEKRNSDDGSLQAQWGHWYGAGNGQFSYDPNNRLAGCPASAPDHFGIAIDSTGTVYIADTYNNRIQLFTPNGQFINKWGPGTSEEEFSRPIDVAIDGKGDVYIADEHYGILKFTGDGEFVFKEEYGFGSGPHSISIDRNGYVFATNAVPGFVACHKPIEKFNPDIQQIFGWSIDWETYMDIFVKVYYPDVPVPDPDDSSFCSPTDYIYRQSIAIENDGMIYVVFRNHVSKFNYDGNYLLTWGGEGTDNGTFDNPSGIAVDGYGNVYVADTNNHRIQKFNDNGTFIDKWGSEGTAEGEFSFPNAVKVDNSGYVYVSDAGNDRIQKFTSNGEHILTWGETGDQPGQFNQPLSVAIDADGNIYVTEAGNNRIQIFNKATTLSNSKAIIVAGKAYEQDPLWDATQMNANFAYNALMYRGFTKEKIYYLTSNTNLDLDSNGELDDVDDTPTKAHLEYAITQWATDADNVVLYLVDHGGDGTFRMSETEILYSDNLTAWLSTLQGEISGEVIVVYDACKSGSFVNELKGDDRIVITSTSPDERAKFLNQGTISFSSFFWTHVLNGLSIEEAFSNASQSINFAFDNQNPQMSGSARNVYIGNGIENMIGDAPEIGNVSPSLDIDNETSAVIFADDVTDTDGISRVWAVIWPPDYNPQDPDKPVLDIDLLSVNLQPDDIDSETGEGRYKVNYSGFDKDGTYQIAIYAMDRNSNNSIPKLTSVSRNYHLTRKAVIVAGGDAAGATRTVIEKSAGLAYDALKSQLYTDDDIYFMSVTGIPGFDVSPSLFFFNDHIESLSDNSSIENLDLVIYLIGGGSPSAFMINDTETLTASGLDSLLDSLQERKPGRVTLIYDGDSSGSFIPKLLPPAGGQRTVISSTCENDTAYFSGEGDVSFSSFFWSQVSSGATVDYAFANAKNAISYLSRKNEIAFSCYRQQTPLLDADGDGTANEESDYQAARECTIGIGMKFADDPPRIGTVSVEETEEGVTIAAKDITSTGTIKRVWAVIKPIGYCPGYTAEENADLPEVELIDPDVDGRYEHTYIPVTKAFKINVYAMDEDNNTSSPVETKIYHTEGADIYEVDDTYQEANPVVINDGIIQVDDTQFGLPQPHTFHAANDEDWVVFYGLENTTYTIEAGNLGPNSHPVIELYDTDGITLIDWDNGTIVGNKVYLEWDCCPASVGGRYYVKLWNKLAYDGDNGTDYELKIYNPEQPFFGVVVGDITDSITGEPVYGVNITTTGYSSISVNGEYEILLPEGNAYTITAWADEYHPYSGKVNTQPGMITINNIEMQPVESPSTTPGGGGGSPGGGGGSATTTTSTPSPAPTTTSTSTVPEAGTTTTVKQVPVPLAITSNPVYVAFVGVLYTYNVETNDGGSGLTCSLNIKPSGMIINEKTGLITWRPKRNQLGDNEVEVKAEGENEEHAEQQFVINVRRRCFARLVLSGKENDLTVLRKLRDKRLANSGLGLSLIYLYYAHSGEIEDILSSNPKLMAQAREITVEMIPVIRSGLKAEAEIRLSVMQYRKITGLLQSIKKQSSPGLQKGIFFVLKKLKTGELFKQMSIKTEESH